MMLYGEDTHYETKLGDEGEIPDEFANYHEDSSPQQAASGGPDANTLSMRAPAPNYNYGERFMKALRDKDQVGFGQVAQDFKAQVQRHAALIVHQDEIIKPINIGGTAGGEKYVLRPVRACVPV